MKKLLLALAFTALSLAAADPTGTWKTTVESPDGSKQELVFEMKLAGGTITGTVHTAMGEMHIVEGKVDGDKIEFTAEFGDFRIPHKGTISGNEMRLESTMMEQKFSLILKKA